MRRCYDIDILDVRSGVDDPLAGSNLKEVIATLVMPPMRQYSRTLAEVLTGQDRRDQSLEH